MCIFSLSQQKTAAADYKKTDEPQPDVKEEEEKAEEDQVKEEKSQPGKNCHRFSPPPPLLM